MNPAFTFALFGAAGGFSRRKLLPALFAAHRNGKPDSEGDKKLVAKLHGSSGSHIYYMGMATAPIRCRKPCIYAEPLTSKLAKAPRRYKLCKDAAGTIMRGRNEAVFIRTGPPVR